MMNESQKFDSSNTDDIEGQINNFITSGLPERAVPM
jgi:hypothetical protein